MRHDKRKPDQLRNVKFEMDYLRNAPASCLVSFGNTRVAVSAFATPGVPSFLQGRNKGWLTAEYAMLPGSTPRRKQRDGAHRDGRSVEIQRLIGRSLRCVVDLSKLGEYTVVVDCDVIDADGGTRTAAITGAWCVLCDLFKKMIQKGELASNPLTGQVAAVSCGVVNDMPVLDLDYIEDSSAEVDMNIVMTSQGHFVEVQGTGEGRAFTADEMQQMLAAAQRGLGELFALQREITGWDA